MERTDIENMRQIPIADFLARLGHEPVRRSGNELWYRAPYRSERTPSFRVNVAKQLWYDFGLGKGGDIFTLVGEFTRSGDFMAQARFIAETARMPLAAAEKPLYLPEPSEPAFEGVEAVPLLRSPLTEYLKERGIPYAVASRHCCRLNYGVRGKRYFAVGFPNVSGGYETRSRRFKGCVPPKDVSLVKAGDIPADVCSVFEGFMDFLSAVTLGLATGDCLVLNSVASLGKGGDIFTLVGEFTRSGDFMAQARFIAETARMPLAAAEKPLYLPEPSEPAFEGVEAVPLLRSPLTEYLKERGIPYAVASRHCCRLNYGVRGKRYFAVGFPNVSGGYETRSRRFKGCVPPKDVSLVKAGDIPADVCSVFEGFMDFLSAVTLGLATGDCLVLNSVANVEKALKHLDGYERIDCYLDRDEAGRRAMEALRTRYGGKVTDRSGIYQGCKDLNEYLQQVSRKQQKNNNLKIKE